ncbi:hypothetical protein AB0K89_01195 [Streptomyces cinnamoneus]
MPSDRIPAGLPRARRAARPPTAPTGPAGPVGAGPLTGETAFPGPAAA